MTAIQYEPKILGFFCHWCCYAAADAAGVARFQYPPNVRVIRVMCTGRIDPIFILEGFVNGADGIFTGGWHLGECHYRSGNYEVINKFKLVTHILENFNIHPDRLSLEWVSAAEGSRFVNLITAYTRRIKAIGPLGSSEGLDKNRLMARLKAARAALEGKRLRMVIARQAKYMKQGETYRKIPEDHKLQKDWEKILSEELSVLGMLSYLKDRPYSVEELSRLLELSSDHIIDLAKKLEKKNLIEKDQLIVT